jgi:Tol biopolymer transport system component/DNA-binding winged helix-turn-helix (wHTH) protein
MEATPRKTRVARFGLFEVDLEQLVLTKSGLRVRLQDQPFQILAMLLERPGELVTRDEIGQKLWSANTFVEFDDGLNTAIRKLRHALGDEADNPRFVETVPRRGYRFIAPVSSAFPSPLSVTVTTHVAEAEVFAPPRKIAASVPDPEPLRRPGSGLAVAVFTILLLCAGGAGSAVWRWSRPPAVPHLVRITQLTRSGAVHPNQNLATDGLRLYYIERGNGDWVLKSMPATGGMGTRMNIPMPRYDLQDISPDASEMLLRRITIDGDADSIWIMPSVGGPVHRVGDVHILAATFTADGRSITFSNGGNVYLCDKDGRNMRKLFSVQGDVLRLRWSPRGDILRFTVNDVSGTTNILWEVHADGSGMHPLLPGWNVPKWEWMMSWSHDARWFAFSAARDGGKDIWLLEHDAASRSSDRKPVQLTAGPIEFDLPLFSADDKRLYAVGVYRHGELLRYDPATRQFAPYLGGISADQLDFSRDRKWVSYVTYPDGVLWRARIDGSEPLKLTETPMRVLAPKWSPDGGQISFLARAARGGKWQAYTVSSNGGLYQRIASGVDETTGAAWFDNGKTLVLSSPQWNELQTMDVATGKMGIFPGTAHLKGALTSPSGRYLIGANEEGTSFELLDIKTGERKLLARDADYPSWSPDERSVYFNRFSGSQPALYRLRLADMKVDKVFDLTAFQAGGSWSIWSTVAPDGSFLVMRDLGGADIYAIDWQSQ